MSLERNEVLEVYRECLKHTIKIVSYGVAIIAMCLFVFGVYIWKSFETVPQTITATQNNLEGSNSISQE